MCQVLAADPETARFVGRPTHFLSHGAITRLPPHFRPFFQRFRWWFLAHTSCVFRFAAVHLYTILSVLAAMESFLAGLPPGEAVFFWFDIFSVDQHVCQYMPQKESSKWWSEVGLLQLFPALFCVDFTANAPKQ